MNVIVAVDSEWGIGYKGDLLARVKEDLQNFARLTTGKRENIKSIGNREGGRKAALRIVDKHEKKCYNTGRRNGVRSKPVWKIKLYAIVSRFRWRI